MGKLFPKDFDPEVRDGDEVSFAPTKNDRSLLAVERGTDSTRRIETDSNNNLYVRNVTDDQKDTLLYTNSLLSIAASTPTTFTAYTAPAAVKVYKVLVVGSAYTDFDLRHNASVIGKKLTNHEMQVEFSFDQGYELGTGDTMDAVVEHCVTGKTKNFNIYIYGE